MSLVHTQYYLQNAEDNTNSKSDFLLDVDLSSTSSHAIIYPEVMLDSTSKTADLWKKIQKQALTKQIDIVGTRSDDVNVSTPVQAFIQTMSAIGALKPVLTSSNLPNPSLSQLLHNNFLANTDCKSIADHIHVVLLLNTLQRLVVEGVLDHVIQNKSRLCVIREDQLLLYVQGKRGVGKSRVIYELEMGFTLMDRRHELMIFASTGCAAKDIGGSTMYKALSISTCKAKSLCTNVSGI